MKSRIAILLWLCAGVASAQMRAGDGWDPGMTIPRAATYVLDSTYFEACPQGGCRGVIPPGGGFWTLSPDFGSYLITCAVNSGAYITKVPGMSEKCPYYFNWVSTAYADLAAQLTLDTYSWTEDRPENNYFGFHENMSYGGVYLGGTNMAYIDNAHEHMLVDVTAQVGYWTANARWLAGVGWSLADNSESYVIEMNFDAMGTFLYPMPEWSTTAYATQNSNCLPVICLYLGGRYWGQPFVFNRGPTAIDIDWTAIVKDLIAHGRLPAKALGHYQTFVMHMGPEIHGKMKIVSTISQVAEYHVQDVRCLACGTSLHHFHGADENATRSRRPE
jgi:hypothetical protein